MVDPAGVRPGRLGVRDPACDRTGNRLQSFAPGPLYSRLESAESTPAGDTAAESPDARERPESTLDTASTIAGDALGPDADRRDAVQAMYE